MRPAGIRIRRRRPVDLDLQPARDGVIGGRIGSRPASRRHRAHAKLQDDGLPDVGIDRRISDVDRVEREGRGPKLGDEH